MAKDHDSSISNENVERIRKILTTQIERNNSFFAVDGLCAMGTQLTSTDAELMLGKKHFNADVARAVSQNADSFSPPVRKQIARTLIESLKSTDRSHDQKVLALRLLGSVANQLSKYDVLEIAAFGQNQYFKLNVPPSDRSRHARLIDRNNSLALQSATAETLVRILERAPNSTTGDGARETAYRAVRDLQLPLADGKGGYVFSTDSKVVQFALERYFQDNRGEPGLAVEINRANRWARVEIPSTDIVWQMLKDSQLAESQEVIALSEEAPKRANEDMRPFVDHIARNYDRSQIVAVSRNIALVNSLPGSDRARLMGWTGLSESQKLSLGWMPEPTGEVAEDLCWWQLSDRQKVDYQWGHALVDTSQTLGQMFNGSLAESLNTNLLKNLSGQADLLSREYELSRRQKEQELEQTVDARSQWEKRLCDTTQWKRQYLLESRIEGIQVTNGRELNRAERDVILAARKLSEANIRADQLRLSCDVSEYQRLRNEGYGDLADSLSIQMWHRHGAALSRLAPQVWTDLTVSRGDDMQGASILKRMHARGAAQVEHLPQYAGGKPEDNLRGFRQALGREKLSGVVGKCGLLQLDANDSYDRSVTKGLRQHMMGNIDSDPVLSRFSRTAAKLNGPMDALFKMCSAAVDGKTYDDFITRCQTTAVAVRGQLNQISQSDLDDLASRIDEMELALAESRNKPRNELAFKDLEQRINSYKKLHNLFNTDPENLKYPDSRERDKNGEPINMRQQLDMFVTEVLNNKLQPPGFIKWLKEEGVQVGLTIAACAATLAACASFGISSPAALGLWMAVVGLGVREVSNEVFYRINRDGYTGWGSYDNQGARACRWADGINQPSDLLKTDNLIALGRDVIGPYAFEIGRDWLAFVGTAALASYFVGGAGSASEAVKGVFRCPPPSLNQVVFQMRRASVIANGNGTGPLFVRQFLQNFSKELAVNTGFTAATEGLHRPIVALAGKQLERTGELGRFGLSFCLSTFLAIGHGALQGARSGHKALFTSAESLPGGRVQFRLAPSATHADVVKFYREQGFQVKTGSRPGEFEVRPFSAKADSKPIIVQDATGQTLGSQPDQSMGQQSGSIKQNDGKVAGAQPGSSEAKRDAGAIDPVRKLQSGPKMTEGAELPATHERVVTGNTGNPVLSSNRMEQVLHPKDAMPGQESVLSKDSATLVTLRDKGSNRGMAVATESGITFISWPPAESVSSGSQPVSFSAKSCIVLLASEKTAYYFNPKTEQVFRVQKDRLGGETIQVMKADVKQLDAGKFSTVFPVIEKVRSLELTGPAGDTAILVTGQHAQNIGGGVRDNIFVEGQGAGLARVGAKRDGYFIDVMGGGRVEIQPKDGAQFALSKGDRYFFRAGDRLFVGGREISLKNGETLSFNPGAGTRAVAFAGRADVDFANTPLLEKKLEAGFQYFDSAGNVPPRVLDPSIDPVLASFLKQARQQFSHLKGRELVETLTKYVHTHLTPQQLRAGGTNVESRQSSWIDRHAA
ncbi:MAG: hypothetical protein K2Z81_24995, partial [Cyanobacteria bacterium]|nr:hypothetical protein [Cyanobacteriota bacterium]